MDSNNDGSKNYLRYNVTLGDSYLQVLEVYKTQSNQENYCLLTKPKIFDFVMVYCFEDGYFMLANNIELRVNHI